MRISLLRSAFSGVGVGLLAAGFGFPSPGLAGDTAWQATASDTWLDPRNWTSGTPSRDDAAVIDAAPAVRLEGEDAEAGSLAVGASASGTIRILSRLATQTATIGAASGAEGHATVIGDRASWQNAGTLVVGDEGQGTLSVEGGASLVTSSLSLGEASGGGGKLIITGQSLATVATALIVGKAGIGELELSSGRLTADSALLGDFAGSEGVAIVSGNRATWTVAHSLTVGGAGSGRLDIVAGGEVASASGTIGDQAGGTGHVRLDGRGSSWTVIDGIAVGTRGSGLLSVSGSASVASGSGMVGAEAGADGKVVINGSDSRWTTGALTVGGKGAGDIEVAAGGTLTSGDSTLGAEAGSDGYVTVSGEGSSWTTKALAIGGNADARSAGGAGSTGGRGTLDVTAGGSVTSDSAALGAAQGATGTASLEGSGSSWTVIDGISIGTRGSGLLAIDSGASVTAAETIVGAETGSEGAVRITGAGSSLEAGQDLVIGDGGSGDAKIAAGGEASAIRIVIGRKAGSSGTTTIEGNGSDLVSSSDITIGEAGSGNLAVSRGGHAAGQEIVLGRAAGASGAASVTGNGSHLASSDTITVGDDGTGTLHVSGGGRVTAANVVVARQKGSTGTVIVGAEDTPVSAGRLGAKTIAFGEGTGTLLLNHSDPDYRLDTALTGNGAVKVLSGTTILTGDSSDFTGTTEIRNARLLVGAESGSDAALAGALQVGDNGLLGGTGSVGTTRIGAGGTLSPGAFGIGTLSVDGDLTLSSGSTYSAELGTDGSSDRVDVTGKAVIEGGSLALTGTRGPGHYTLLTASEGVTGRFDTLLATSRLFLDLALDYESGALSLAVTRNGLAFQDAAISADQRAVAAAAESLGAGNALYDALLLSPDTVVAAGAYTALSGQVHGEARRAVVQQGRFLRDAVGERLRTTLRDDPPSRFSPLAYTGDDLLEPPAIEALSYAAGQKTGHEPDATQRNIWARAFGSWGAFSAETGRPGYSIKEGGFVAGLDNMVGSAWRLGTAVVLGRASLDGRDGADAVVDSYGAALYGGRHIGAFGLTGGAAYSFNHIETKRDVVIGEFAERERADYWNRTGQVFGELSYETSLAALAIEPFAGLAFMHVEGADISETGQIAGLAGDFESQNLLFSTLGLRASSLFTLPGGRLALVAGHVGWRHAEGDLSPASTLRFAAGGPSFSTQASPVAADAALLGASLSVAIAEMTMLSFSYDGEFAGKGHSHDFNGSFSMRF
ncbi:outer membrane autotransporter protein [Rhodopseudomonas julia]|uniref:Outer membrane autotransporter protein n=1 Tax=Rhodopseudomonas julia TaxID=200617 RepID=A0ABU0C4A9_9BRAD|nr:autotransporter domain-containing protein [Rhodopseudomonas julia]MDQ0325028.1 outer membrane autotransporter protein [Rhodopseudomonas julia]